MKSIVIGLVIFMLSLPAFAQTQTKAAQPQTQTQPKAAKPGAAGQDAEFKALIAKYYEGWNTLNPDNVASFYAKEGTLVFYDLTPLQYKGWQAYKQGVVQVFQTFSTMKLVPNNDLKVTKRGKVAWTTMTFHVSAAKKDGTKIEADGRHTAVWEKKGGKWLIVHEHVSAPLPEA